MSEEDLWLRMKKLELQKKFLAMTIKKSEEKREESAKSKDPYEAIKPFLEERADEVLEAARAQYPRVADTVVKELIKLVEAGLIKKITGPWLMGLFTRLGYRPRLETKISIVSDGRTMELKEKIAKYLRDQG
ncbi:MAG: hypothetical protein N3F04_06910 [Candidatus Nezhaarchaeota archaeon]|nr:hypothetical protein [Candidatus Nezhaarchaeota archaeon]MCX8142472.1 hypothetical protein [Candidatus Nezhaarchaeota archaeon]MDW8050555.1 hypothetical protein [Nitrososphaerota archaeon]